MKKINKILLPITSIAAIAAPTVCMVSCANKYFKETISYFNIDYIEQDEFIRSHYGITDHSTANWETEVISFGSSSTDITDKIDSITTEIIELFPTQEGEKIKKTFFDILF